VQRAKRLIDEKSLPMTEIAMLAGFVSLRRFNSVFAEGYGRPPTKIGAIGLRAPWFWHDRSRRNITLAARAHEWPL
jgi:AraC-like DNA-binding protein